MAPILKIEKLTKRYPHADTLALHEINLEVEEGEFFGLLGPNGSGKTTTISILCGLLDPSSGHTSINGFAIPRHNNKIKRIIGLVPQEVALYPTLSFKENLEFIGHLYDLKRKALRDRIEFCLNVSGLGAFAKRKVGLYSGGMQRRANLAATLLHNPKLLFLDEPTVNVDPQSRNMIFDILNELNKQGTTMVYTTHYLEEAQQFCSRVAIIDAGRIIRAGTPDALISQTEGCEDLGQVFLKLTGHDLRD